MKEFVSDRRTRVVISMSCIMLIWAVFVVPGGAPWTGMVWLGALPLLLVATATMLLSTARTPSMQQVLQGVEGAPKAIAATRPRSRIS
jgi:hypothetical protein